jgi:hypothetical protein
MIMYDLEWTELADEMCVEFPSLAPEVILREIGEAVEAVELIDIGEDAAVMARSVVRGKLADLAFQGREIRLDPVVISDSRGSEAWSRA